MNPRRRRAIVALQDSAARVWQLDEGIPSQPMLCRHTSRMRDAVLLWQGRVVVRKWGCGR